MAGAADLRAGQRQCHQPARCGPPYRHAAGFDGPSFPRGKQQLIEDALVFAGKQVSGPLAHLTKKHGAVGGLRAFIRLWRQTLEATEIPGRLSRARGGGRAICQRCDGKRWRAGRSRAKTHARSGGRCICRVAANHDHGAAREGIAAARARRLAALVIASVEGTVAMCRAARSAQPLDDVEAGARTGTSKRAGEVGPAALPAQKRLMKPGVFAPTRHARACPGHPRPCCIEPRKTWMAGTSSAKTRFALLPGHDGGGCRFDSQNVGGVQALITSQGLPPTQRKRCGRRLSK